MVKQSIVLINFDELYNILDEVNHLLKFKISNYNDLKDPKKEIENYAWISLATDKFVYSKRLVLVEDRLSNIAVVSLALLELLRKEII